MAYQKYLLAGAVSAFGLLLAPSANASYMSKCNTHISAWQNCTETGQSCTTEFKTIETDCKCHAFKQGEWKLITAAVGKDGVCNATFPYDDVPPHDDVPPPDEHKKKKKGNLGGGSADIDGNDKRDRGGPKDGNKGRGNN